MENNKGMGIKISLLSKEQASNIAFGKIKNSKTLNYKNMEPSKGGLFCDKIFGSSTGKCHCGRTFSYDEQNFICKNCGVETSIKNDNFKRKRFGFIELREPLINGLYYKIYPNYLSTLTDLTSSDIKKILNNNLYLVLYTKIKAIKLYQTLTNEQYFFLKKKYFNKFYAERGTKSLYYILKNKNVENEYNSLSEFLKFNFNYLKTSSKKKIKKYKILRNMNNFGVNPLGIFVENLLVLPPDLRPIVKLSNESIVSSDLNELYKRIINSNIRLKKMKRFFGIPSCILHNEKKILQNHLNNLFIGGAKNNSKPLKSLTENLKGKTGFFRKNLLGKRVDYSARAVIVSGANLKYGECAIPKIIAMELFRPFIYNKILIDDNFNIKTAKQEVDKMSFLATKILLKLVKGAYILLNRAPTLHRLGMQTFKILITDDKAIKLHPLVCAAYNADFDGDQMAAHIPITTRPRIEYKSLLFSGNNVLHPSNGSCCVGPTKDIILGIYWATKAEEFEKNKKYFFNNLNEALVFFNHNYINLNTKIFLRFKEFENKNFSLVYKIHETTLGRILTFNCFPDSVGFNNLNKNLNKKDFSKILDFWGNKNVASSVYSVCDNLMRAGFNFATKLAPSISIDDMFFFYEKKNIFNKIKKILISYNVDYLNFFLTKNSKKKKILELWEIIFNKILNSITFDLSYSNYLDSRGLFLKKASSNSLWSMLDSGARGSISQINQICCNRGLIDYKKYGFFETPVINSLRDGLTVLEYFYFTHNSRKTLADTALKTASAGYLTRRLVECANNVFISQKDCGTEKGIKFRSLIYKGELIDDFYERITGRFLLEDFCLNNSILVKKNTLIDEVVINLFKKYDLNSVNIRTPLKCIAQKGICALCYGVDLSKGKVVNIGEMVGIVAAQAIGEPGTQLTMRTFHSGGAITKNVEKSFFKSNVKGFLKYSDSLKFIINNENLKIAISKISKIKIFNEIFEELENFDIPYGSYLLIENETNVDNGELICKWDPENKIKISETGGILKFINFLEGLNFLKRNDINCYEIINYKIKPLIYIYKDDDIIEKYEPVGGELVMFKDGDKINIGDIIIKKPLDFTIAKDIIGGLPKINNLFEARVPKNCALLAPIDGFISFNNKKKKNIINILDNEKKILFSSFFSFKKKIMVDEGQCVNKGDILIDGELSPHDILKIYDLDYMSNFLLGEIKFIYFSQGIRISDKHLEIIISQMLKMAVIISPGESSFLPGEIVLIKEIENFNKNFLKKKITYEIVLTGITSKSLKSESFLSAASFQKTSYILSEAAISSKYDDMTSLKNFVMVGGVFIAGSGSYSKILNF